VSNLQFESITKTFPGVKALDKVSFDVPSGSVHALCGENGAGKSTLLKVLSGVHPADSGTITLDGTVLKPVAPIDAIRAGVSIIYQELHLFDELSVAENLYVGHLPSQVGMLKKSELHAKAREVLAGVGAEIDPKTKCGDLPIAQRQMVEIAKAMTHDAQVIAFDEPTSSLSEREVEKLFALIERLRDQGRIILYVSHRMDEIFRICDAATILRDGQHVVTYETLEGVTRDDIVSSMVGRSIEDIYDYRSRKTGEPVLVVDDLTGPGLAQPVDLSVKAGEIVGLYGLVGAGRTELMNLIYGSAKKSGGSAVLGSAKQLAKGPLESIKAGVVYCPEDRKKQGIVPIRSVQENINLTVRKMFSPGGMLISSKAEKSHAADQIEKLKVKTANQNQEINNLSGGNQQKSILARWLSTDVKVVLLDEPTRGIDVGAKSEIYNIIYRLAESGVAVLVATSELPEVLGICDRIAVMCDGKVTGILDRSEATEEAVVDLSLPKGGSKIA
jgi:L-arabinose transport system ATP-binding protein